ncbi:hypothetical protein M9H77_07358 [Catharanthus roseus]|uniref:Uncharacterized protein n=1 Tax=Catharanthus roseus TaxID=4058 RepID=A0ACC0BV33_CATRO|nr:hypothetical protein M9H77_07358 [Catharanthus roseus]
MKIYQFLMYKYNKRFQFMKELFTYLFLIHKYNKRFEINKFQFFRVVRGRLQIPELKLMSSSKYIWLSLIISIYSYTRVVISTPRNHPTPPETREKERYRRNLIDDLQYHIRRDMRNNRIRIGDDKLKNLGLIEVELILNKNGYPNPFFLILREKGSFFS